MLLPAEKLSSLASLTPALLLDHLILADTARSVASTSSLSTQPVRGFATLSGFRGVIDSCVPSLALKCTGAYSRVR